MCAKTAKHLVTELTRVCVCVCVCVRVCHPNLLCVRALVQECVSVCCVCVCVCVCVCESLRAAMQVYSTYSGRVGRESSGGGSSRARSDNFHVYTSVCVWCVCVCVCVCGVCEGARARASEGRRAAGKLPDNNVGKKGSEIALAPLAGRPVTWRRQDVAIGRGGGTSSSRSPPPRRLIASCVWLQQAWVGSENPWACVCVCVRLSCLPGRGSWPRPHVTQHFY